MAGKRKSPAKAKAKPRSKPAARKSGTSRSRKAAAPTPVEGLAIDPKRRKQLPAARRRSD